LHLLIRGPAASGKSRLALERFHAVAGSRLIVPSATMAEHLRHQLAREGHAIRPNSVQTLGNLLDSMSSSGAIPKAPSAPLLAHLVEQALGRLPSRRWNAVADLAGFHRAVAELIQEAPAAGLQGDWARLLEQIDHDLAERGLARRNLRLKAAAHAAHTCAPALVFDGFFSFSSAETDLLLALSRISQITVTLPAWPGAESALARLAEGLGHTHDTSPATYRRPALSCFAMPAMEREAEEIARLIIEQVDRGRRLREIGILLRTREPYGSLLETTLARFGIPARFYFADPVKMHPAIAYISAVIHSLLNGWDREPLLSALRMPVSGLGATGQGDRLDFDWRARLPEFGLPRESDPLFERLAVLDPLRRELLPPREWARRLRALNALLPVPQPHDGASWDEVHAWRSTAYALRAFEDALDAAADLTGDAAHLGLGSFWRRVEHVLAIEPLRLPDRRRDCVHVLDVVEARQWELPCIFVCGMTERHFPQYHREDPLLGDAERRRLGLTTAAERQAQERFLFDFAVSRATEAVILSYPRFDEQGEKALPSFFLAGIPLSTAAAPTARPIGDAAGGEQPEQAQRGVMQMAQSRLSPSAIESFLQCPFQFFARYTLGLRPRPPAPRDRLDVLAQGSILHRILAEHARTPLPGRALFEQIFEEECEKRRIPRTYRTEAVRLELLRNFEAFLADRSLNLAGWQTRTEEKFEFPLETGLAIHGRIDRLEIATDRRALVIDYKYSAPNRIHGHVEDSAGGHRVQAGLYLAAAERALALAPAGMLFCGVKKEIAWEGWHASIGLRAGTASTNQVLRDLIAAAEQSARRAHAGILAGRIEPEPANPDQCRSCDFRDICRIEAASRRPVRATGEDAA
jgi:CRISPR/Cas system-associated exonuclease Cas4 (RecB family)